MEMPKLETREFSCFPVSVKDGKIASRPDGQVHKVRAANHTDAFNEAGMHVPLRESEQIAVVMTHK